MNQLLTAIKSLPLSKQISMAFILSLVVAGFVFMFFLANQEDYQILFNNLSAEDGGAIVAKLQEKNIPYRVGGAGNTIMVPAAKVHELRLTLAGEGLPNGGQVGFEVFDNTNFGATKFVQELNFRRALQGELARTINQFKEVKNSRVFIVIPKETLFVEERKPASASIQLDLRSRLPATKAAAIVHLVANAVDGLDSDQITVVDTKGRVIFKGTGGGNTSSLSNTTQLDYKRQVENEIKDNVQTMLQEIVGVGKAIVRVTAEIDFEKITLNEEEYDPSTTVVRSRRNREESSQVGEGTAQTNANVNQRRGVVPPQSSSQNQKAKKDSTINYEINKIIRTTVKPAGTIKRLSVAAVIDGQYKIENSEDGSTKKTYIPRTEEELQQFGEIVKKAMGYSEDREDQVSVSSIAFSEVIPNELMAAGAESQFDLLKFVGGFRKTIINFGLILMVLFLIVRPLLKSLKNVKSQVVLQPAELSAGGGDYQALPESNDMNQRQQALQISTSDSEKAQQVIKGWIGDME